MHQENKRIRQKAIARIAMQYHIEKDCHVPPLARPAMTGFIPGHCGRSEAI